MDFIFDLICKESVYQSFTVTCLSSNATLAIGIYAFLDLYCKLIKEQAIKILTVFFFRQFVRSNAVPTVGQKSLNKSCPTLKPNGRPCRGKLHDCILDWEHNLPENDLGMADFHSW